MAGVRRWTRVFEAEVAASAKALGLYYEKRPVAQTGMGKMRMSRKVPDGFLVVGGVHVDLEMKSLAVHGSFPLAAVSPEQEQGWERLLSEGAPGFLLVNMRRKKKPGHAVLRAPRRKGARAKDPTDWTEETRAATTVPMIQAWAMPAALWPFLKEELADIGRKSVPYEWFLDPLRFAAIPRLPRDRDRRPAIWDLRTGLGTAAKLLARPVARGLIVPDLPTMLSLALARRDFTREVAADLATISLGE